MRARKWRQWVLLSVGWLVGCMVLFSAWIGVVVLLGSTDRDAPAVSLNLIAVFFLAGPCLIVWHRALYRYFWHIARKRAAGLLRPGDPGSPFGSEPTAPSPHIDWFLAFRCRHALLYLITIITLIMPSHLIKISARSRGS